ncbi:MAG: DUF3576 domain-containing protein, partial [Alphaproteobacteria bacterium]
MYSNSKKSGLGSWLPIIGCICVLSGCGNVKEAPAPLPIEEERKSNFGNAFGEEFLLFGKGARRSIDKTPVANVNACLWQASLETIAFLPLQSADATGGVIITDWYTVPQTPHERLKITIRIIGQDLRSDALTVLINRQVLSKNGTWVDGAQIASQTLTDGAMIRIGTAELAFRHVRPPAAEPSGKVMKCGPVSQLEGSVLRRSS